MKRGLKIKMIYSSITAQLFQWANAKTYLRRDAVSKTQNQVLIG